jgi:hypothetical protein
MVAAWHFDVDVLYQASFIRQARLPKKSLSEPQKRQVDRALKHHASPEIGQANSHWKTDI